MWLPTGEYLPSRASAVKRGYGGYLPPRVVLGIEGIKSLKIASRGTEAATAKHLLVQGKSDDPRFYEG